MTALPKKVAKTNWYVLILDNPATTLITEDGENGKHNKRNKGPKPCFSTQPVTLCTCLFFRILMNIRLSPSRRIIINNKTEPTLVPIHEYKNHFNNPYAALLAIIITSNGKKGRKASMNGKAIPGIGPNFS